MKKIKIEVYVLGQPIGICETEDEKVARIVQMATGVYSSCLLQDEPNIPNRANLQKELKEILGYELESKALFEDECPCYQGTSLIIPK